VIESWTPVFTEGTTFWVMESIRLDLGYGSGVAERGGDRSTVVFSLGLSPRARAG
jgi:hypothetical protein